MRLPVILMASCPEQIYCIINGFTSKVIKSVKWEELFSVEGYEAMGK